MEHKKWNSSFIFSKEPLRKGCPRSTISLKLLLLHNYRASMPYYFAGKQSLIMLMPWVGCLGIGIWECIWLEFQSWVKDRAYVHFSNLLSCIRADALMNQQDQQEPYHQQLYWGLVCHVSLVLPTSVQATHLLSMDNC